MEFPIWRNLCTTTFPRTRMAAVIPVALKNSAPLQSRALGLRMCHQWCRRHRDPRIQSWPGLQCSLWSWSLPWMRDGPKRIFQKMMAKRMPMKVFPWNHMWILVQGLRVNLCMAHRFQIPSNHVVKHSLTSWRCWKIDPLLSLDIRRPQRNQMYRNYLWSQRGTHTCCLHMYPGCSHFVMFSVLYRPQMLTNLWTYRFWHILKRYIFRFTMILCSSCNVLSKPYLIIAIGNSVFVFWCCILKASTNQVLCSASVSYSISIFLVQNLSTIARKSNISMVIVSLWYVTSMNILTI